MTAQELIYRAVGEPHEHELEDYLGRCACCGQDIEKGVRLKKVVSSAFTGWSEFQGDYVCEACAHLLGGELATKLRRTSFVATPNEIITFKNTELARYLFKPPKPPFVFCVTTSFKKHNAYRAVLNYSRDDFVIRWEDNTVHFSRKSSAPIFASMLRLYYAGFSKQELINGNYSFKRIMDFGIEAWHQEEKIMSDWRGTLVFELLVHALSNAKREVYQKAKKEARRNDGGSRKGGQAALFDLAAH